MARRPRRPDHDAGLHPACLDCGTTGGAAHPNGSGDPTFRRRRLCTRCYNRHHKARDLARFPFAQRTLDNRLDQPAIPRHYLDPFMLGCTRDQHAVVPAGWQTERVIAESEQYATAWLARPDRRVAATTWMLEQAVTALEHLRFAEQSRAEAA